MEIQVDYRMGEEAQVVIKGLQDFNLPFLGPSIPFTLYFKDQQVVAGLTAWMKPVIHMLWIDFIWVSEPLRRQGLGKKLMLAAEAEGIKHGCTHAQLETLPFQAIPFYLGLGYQEIGCVKKIYGEHDALYMRKRIK